MLQVSLGSEKLFPLRERGKVRSHAGILSRAPSFSPPRMAPVAATHEGGAAGLRVPVRSMDPSRPKGRDVRVPALAQWQDQVDRHRSRGSKDIAGCGQAGSRCDPRVAHPGVNDSNTDRARRSSTSDPTQTRTSVSSRVLLSGNSKIASDSSKRGSLSAAGYEGPRLPPCDVRNPQECALSRIRTGSLGQLGCDTTGLPRVDAPCACDHAWPPSC